MKKDEKDEGRATNQLESKVIQKSQDELIKGIEKDLRNARKRVKRDQLKLAQKIIPGWIKQTTKNYLAQNPYPLLSSSDEEHLGGKRWSDDILGGFFKKDWRKTSPAKEMKDYFSRKNIPDNYWEVTRSYLKRFFYVQDYKKKFKDLYEYELIDDPKPKNYPTPEQRERAFERHIRKGKGGRIWDIILKEEEEKESENIRWSLAMLGKDPYLGSRYGIFELGFDLGFRYDIFLKPEMLDFFKERGFRIDSLPLLNFLLSISTPNFFEWYHKERKDGIEFNLFDEHTFPEYFQLKKGLLGRGVNRDVFDTAEYYFLRQNLIMFLRGLTSFARPLFLIAYFLKKEHPKVYRQHLETIKFYLGNIQSATTPVEKDLAGYLLWVSIHCLPLFRAVYEDYLFDGDRYLKIKLKKEGRPKDIVTKALVYIFIEGFNKQKQSVRGSVYETTAKLVDSMFKFGHLFGEVDQDYHYPLSAEAVNKIWKRIRKRTKLKKKSKT